MSKYYDENGDPITEEVFSKADVEKQIEELKSSGGLSDEEKAELIKLRDKSMNFKNVNDKVNRLKEKIKEYENDGAGEGGDGAAAKAAKETTANKLADDAEAKEKKLKADYELLGDDTGLDDGQKKKAIFLFNQLTANVTDPELQKVFMADAVRLASTPADQGTVLGGSAASSGGRQSTGSGSEAETAEARAIREGLGVTAEDKKTYGGDDWKPAHHHLK